MWGEKRITPRQIMIYINVRKKHVALPTDEIDHDQDHLVPSTDQIDHDLDHLVP